VSAARAGALRARSEQAAWRVLNREARRVMRAYTTSFFIVSRFLPRAKREEVEAVYAAVRYPDEVVDTFPLGAKERLHLLDEWGAHYETGIKCATLREALRRGVPAHLAGFTRGARARHPARTLPRLPRRDEAARGEHEHERQRRRHGPAPADLRVVDGHA
jgi:hypothetical protein